MGDNKFDQIIKDLLSCPFCGVKYWRYVYDFDSFRLIHKDECHLRLSRYKGIELIDNEEDEILRWNKRI